MNTVALTLELDGRPTTLRVPLPDGERQAEDLLPAMYAVDDAIVAAAVAAQPHTVSCRKGCSACCRVQPVPVTPTEARALAAWIEGRPPARRARLKARFSDRVARLEAAGLRHRLDGDAPPRDAAEARAVAQAYHHLGLTCPFLENDVCSIHDRRPFVCRQYLVTSPAAHCRDPLSRPVEVVRLPVRPAHALLRATAGDAGVPPRTIPLVLALEATRRQPAPPRCDAARTFTHWLSGLADGPTGAPA